MPIPSHPSPMALTKPSTSADSLSKSIFKKKSTSALNGIPQSAASYLSALSQADAEARARSGATSLNGSPNSTPALSISSSLTDDSEDTVLHDYEYDSELDPLARPSPPTSYSSSYPQSQFTTVHSEFGHCSNEEYRATSAHPKGQPLEMPEEKDPPYYILLSTYVSYLILICLGHVRDFLGKRVHSGRYRHLMPRDVRSHFIHSSLIKVEHGLVGLCSSELGFRLVLHSST